MTFKTLLAVATDQTHVTDILTHAASLAQACEAHLDVLCLGVDRTQTGFDYAGVTSTILQNTLAQARDEATSLAAQVKAQLKTSTELRWGVIQAVCPLADVARLVGSHARFADLTLAPRPYGQDRGVELEPVVEGALFEGQAPVIILPQSGPTLTLPGKIAVGWNESAEALRAVRSALPLLRQAQITNLMVIDPPQHGPNRSDPGGQVSQFLARHGVTVEIDVLSKTLPQVSDVMRRHASDTRADLVVMGAYGHSRFREAILGGATRSMLESSDLPVFMAH